MTAESMKRSAPAAARNREPIAAILREELPQSGLVLEVASGTGEHAAFYAGMFPRLDWQPTDADVVALPSIDSWREDAGLANLRPALLLDAEAADWPVTECDAILCINMVHISPVEATVGLLAGAARLLAPGAPLILYGPYLEADVDTAPSNVAFDVSLKARDPRWGLREVSWLDRVAAGHGFARSRRAEMPANNLMLVYRRA